MLFLLLPPSIYSQNQKIQGFAETGIMAGTGGRIPFWMMSNRFGRFTPASQNTWIDAGIFSDSIGKDKKYGMDWGAEIFGRYDRKLYGWLQQGYIGGKAGIFYFFAGLKEEHFGSQDPDLSSGFLPWSGNARPIPKVSLSTPDFVSIPFTKGFAEFKGGISHSWFGRDGYVKKAYLHHKYLYLRFGGSHAFHLTTGIHHFAQWGGVSPVYGRMPSHLNDFFKVFLARGGGDSIPGVPWNEWANRFGNHQGTRDISVDYRLRTGLKIKAYWQNFIEDITGLGFRNISDGLWGIQVENPGKMKIGYEFFRSKTGNFKIKNGALTGGSDDYFNHSIYRSGWTYQEYTIGNPLITSPVLLPNPESSEHIINNRVVSHVLNIELLGRNNCIKLIFSHSENYGGKIVLFDPVKKQNSLLLSLERYILPDKLRGVLSLGFDQGDLLGNHAGIGLNLRWIF